MVFFGCVGGAEGDVIFKRLKGILWLSRVSTSRGGKSRTWDPVSRAILQFRRRQQGGVLPFSEVGDERKRNGCNARTLCLCGDSLTRSDEKHHRLFGSVVFTAHPM